MPLNVTDHALASSLVAKIRDVETQPTEFRRLTRALTQILVVEAARDLPVSRTVVRTPLEETNGATLAAKLAAVPVLRAGLGMLEPTLELLPNATVGYVGLQRDEETAIPSSYYCKLPDLNGAIVFMLDPMLATGGSAIWAARQLYERGASEVRLLCVVAAPEGVAALNETFPALRIFAAALDRELDDRKYILPGLGDFGDRLYGTD